MRVNQLVRRAGNLTDPAAARKGILRGIDQLQRLAAVQPTFERANLIGSAYKRLTMVEWKAGRSAAAEAALAASVEHYGVAEAMARKSGADTLHYPAKIAIGAELRAAFIAGRKPALDADRVKAVSDSLEHAASTKPDFWSVAGQTELLMLLALARGELAPAEPALTAALRDLKKRVPAVQMWGSVLNEAQFTLEPYLKVAPSAEKRAAQTLLDALAALAAA